MPQERQLLPQMHELLIYLSRRGVLSLLIMSQHGIVGNGLIGSVDISYLVDTVVLIRHFEAFGTLKKALPVVKKRHGGHESTIRELRLRPGGIEISEPITEFSGVLTGTPTFSGDARALLDHHPNHHAEDDRS